MPTDFSTIPEPTISPATKMLAAGLERARAERGMTQKDVAERLGYKSSVVISHMASGRVPVPADRALDIANVIGLDPSRFVIAVLESRFPELKIRELLGVRLASHGKVADRLELLAARDLDDLDVNTVGVLEEVVAASDPRRRWLALEELVLVEQLRRQFPDLKRKPLTDAERAQLESCLGASLSHRSATAASARRDHRD